jgi:flavin-dependent thymidylate synthase
MSGEHWNDVRKAIADLGELDLGSDVNADLGSLKGKVDDLDKKPGKTVQKWADEAMFTAEPSDATDGPRVYLLSAPADPLGSIAAAAKMYSGEVVRDLADVTDEDRHHYLGEMQKTKLAMPLEAVQFHFLFDGVTRAFTHQLVRQRTAAYAQESMRFAVVEDSFVNRVALPPSLVGTLALGEGDNMALGAERDTQQWQRNVWDQALQHVQEAYTHLVDSGMPAEDARGLLPTNITTRVHYITNLRSLLDHAGNRLCTQAQFEWRSVFAQLAKALREHVGTYFTDGNYAKSSNNWQYKAIAELLKPVCYQQGRCPMKADFDRKCSIRARVDRFAEIGAPSSEWHKDVIEEENTGLESHPIREHIIAVGINPVEWLADPSAAR